MSIKDVVLELSDKLDHSNPDHWEADGSPKLAVMEALVGQKITLAQVAEVNGSPYLRNTDVPIDLSKAAAKPLAPMPPAADELDDVSENKPDAAGVQAGKQTQYTQNDAAADRDALAAMEDEWHAAMLAQDTATRNLARINRERDRLIERIGRVPSEKNSLHEAVRRSQEQSMKDNEARAAVNAKLRELTGGATTTPHASPLDARMAGRRGVRRQAARMGA